MGVWNTNTFRSSSGYSFSGDTCTSVSATGGAEASAFSLDSIAPGEKKYFEYLIVLDQANNETFGIGFGGEFATGGWVGQQPQSIGYWDNGAHYKGSTGAGFSMPGTYTTGDVISLAIDRVNDLFWFRKNGGDWNGSPSADPATGTGGNSLSGINGNIYIQISPNGSAGDAVTGRQRSATWSYSPPSGFSAIGEGLTIQAVQNSSEGRTSGVTSTTAAFPVAPTIGNKIVALAAMWDGSGAPTGTVTDNYSNTWTRRSFSTITNVRLEVWETTVTSTGSGFTMTLTSSLSGAELNFIGVEFSGLGSFDQDATFANLSAGTTAVVGPTSTLASSESLVVTVVTTDNGQSDAQWTAPTGYTLISVQQNSSILGYASARKTVTSNSAVTASWSFVSQTNRTALLAVFSEQPTAVVAPGPIFQPVGNQPPGGVRGASIAHAEAATAVDETNATVGAIYVSTTGNDTTGTGTFADPYATVGKASTVVAAGQHILMRGGTYSGAQVQFSGPGTPSQPIVLQPYNGETVIIDGTGTPAATDLLAVGGTYCVVRGLQVRNATQSGIALWQTIGCVVERCTIYNCQQSAIWIGTDTPGTSHDNAVRWNTAYNCGLVNASEALGGGGGWPSIIKFEISDNFECVYNTVYESWGEGIGADSCATGGLIAYNSVRDCYSVLIYLDNTARTVVTGNVLSGINSAWYKLGAQTDSILVANESGSPVQIASDNIQATGNFITGKHTAQWTGGGGTYQTLSNSALDPNFYLAALAESGSAADTSSQTVTGGGTTYNVSTAETGSAADTPAATQVRVGATAEAGTATDTPAAAFVAGGTVSEAGSAADAPAAALAAIGAVTEAGSAADASSGSTVRIGAVAETGSAADTSDFSLGGTSATSETLSAADTPSAQLAAVAATAETGSASDASATALVAAASAPETGSAADTATAALSRAGADAESGAASDTLSAALTAVASVAETLAAADTQDSSGGNVSSVAEAGSAADTSTTTLAAVAGAAETGTASDSVSAALSVSAAVAETGSAADTSAATHALATSVAETANATDTVTSTGGSGSSTAETAAATDTSSSALSAGGTVAESASAADAQDSARVISVSVAEAASAVETISAALSAIATLAEAVAGADTVAASLAASAAVAEAVSAVETISDGSGAAVAELLRALDTVDATGGAAAYYDPVYATLAAIRAKLLGDPSLVAYLATSTAVYSQPPARAATPFITIGEVAADDFATSDRDGEEVFVDVACWDEAPSQNPSPRRALDMARRVRELLHFATLTVPAVAHHHVLTQVVSGEAPAPDDPYGTTLKGTVRVRALVDQA